MEQETTEESVEDYSGASLEELEAKMGIENGSDEVATVPETEEPTVEEEQSEPVEDGITDDKSDPLDKTPFKDVSALVDAYKEIQSSKTKSDQRLSKLEEQYNALLQVDDEEFEDAQIDDESADEFMTKAEALEMVEKEIKKRDAKQMEINKDEKVSKSIKEARSLPNFNEDGVMDLMRVVPIADNIQLDNPLITANTIVDEGLTNIYKSNPNLHLLADGGLKVARNLLRAESIPEIKEATEKQAKAEIQKAKARNSQAKVATSSSNTQPVGDKDYSKMKFEDLEAEMGVVNEESEFDI